MRSQQKKCKLNVDRIIAQGEWGGLDLAPFCVEKGSRAIFFSLWKYISLESNNQAVRSFLPELLSLISNSIQFILFLLLVAIGFSFY